MIITLAIGFILLVIGLWGLMTQKNIIKMIIAFSIVDTGTHVIIVSIGYIKGRTAPILDSAVKSPVIKHVIDPVPSALVLTAIVIGLATTALMLSYAIQLYKKKKTLNVDEYKDLKW